MYINIYSSKQERWTFDELSPNSISTPFFLSHFQLGLSFRSLLFFPFCPRIFRESRTRFLSFRSNQLPRFPILSIRTRSLMLSHSFRVKNLTILSYTHACILFLVVFIPYDSNGHNNDRWIDDERQFFSFFFLFFFSFFFFCFLFFVTKP